MNLADAIINTIIDPLRAGHSPVKITEVPIEDATVVESSQDGSSKCARCEVEGSKPLKNNTCDTCGAAWEDSDDDQDDFQTALELLGSCQTVFESILKARKLVNKMGAMQEASIRDLAFTIEDFLETYSEWDPSTES